MNDINILFFDLIRVAIGTQDTLSRAPSAAEWKALYDMALKQSLVGICFAGIQRLKPSELAAGQSRDESESEGCEAQTLELSETLRLRWMGMAAKIQQRNEIVNRQCAELVKSLKLRGYRSCILKGQGIAALYSIKDECLELRDGGLELRDKSLELRDSGGDSRNNSQLSTLSSQLGKLRQSGDIDVYVDCGRAKAIEYARSIQDEVDWDYKHLHLKVFPDTEVEVHYRPEVLINLWKNRRLQRWFEEPEVQSSMFQVSGDLVAPSVEFNVFYILLHIYRHFLFEGVGLRQLMDYYFVLVAFAEHELPQIDHEFSINSLLNGFGMARFARGVMWIMQEVFGLEKEYLICSTDEKEGRYILREVMEGGNFGHHNERLSTRIGGKKGTVVKILRHNWHLLAHYPSEALWAPVYFVWHYFWKKVRA